MRIVYQSSAAFSRFERAANAELLSVVIVLKIAPMCSLYSFKSVSKAAITLLADLSSSLTIMNSLVLHSKRVRRASSWPNFAPITRSHSQCLNSFRFSTSLGFFNTPAKFSLCPGEAYVSSFFCSVSWADWVSDIQEPHVDIVVQRLCANHLILGKISRYESIAHADIKRPPC